MAAGSRTRGRGATTDALAFAPVLASACQKLDLLFDTKKGLGRHTAMFKFAFWTLAHLLAHGGEWYIPTEVFVKLGGAKDNSIRANQVKRLINENLIQVTQEPSWSKDDEGGTATWYCITDALLNLMLDSDDSRSYATPNDYTTNHPFKAKPYDKLHGSFDERLAHEPDPTTIILNLQHQPLHFDRMEFIRWLRLNRAALTAAEVRKQLGFAMALQEGPNYTRYQLARSGRLLTVESNLQGTPKTMRRWFKPHEGYTFWSFDYKSQEPRIFAHLSDDAKLQAAVQGDIYLMIANRYGLDRDAQVKPMFNAWLYGAGAVGIARAIYGLPKKGMPTPEQLSVAKGFKDFMREEFPDSAAWVSAKVKEIRAKGCAVTPGGFVREHIESRKASTTGINHFIQGCGADILRATLRKLEVRLAGTGARIVLTLHDGLLAEILEVDADVVVTIIKETMEETVSEFLPRLFIPVKDDRGWPGKFPERILPAPSTRAPGTANRAA